MEDNTLLEVRDLEIKFGTENGDIRAINNISFSLKRGETLGIVGESGSGKSITSLSLMQLLPMPPAKITSGRILFYPGNGECIDLLKLSEKEIRSFRGNRISMIFQEPMTSLNPVYTCGDQVMEVLIQHKNISKKEAEEQTIELFNEVKLPRPESIFKSYPHQLSGGQRQRVMIAMAMACDPEILIADEPTTALDVTVQKTILELMLDLQKKHNMSIIFITHDLGVIAEIAHRVLVMYKGDIVEQGSVDEVLNKPKHDYTKGLMACRPSLEGRLKRLPTVSDYLNKTRVREVYISDEERRKNHMAIYQNEPMLSVKSLKTSFPLKKNFFGKTIKWVNAVDDVSFDLYKGETLGLVGESGCGKTTLGRTILQLIENNHGDIIYKGKNLSKLSRRELRKLRKNIQIIFQDPYSSLNPRLTVGESIIEPMKVHNVLSTNKQRKEKAIELLKKVNLDEESYYKYPHQFSGGQRQRIGIARALALNPEFIICDESVSALDVSVQAQVLNLLNELKEEYNLTYIFISHDLGVVKYMSDRMVVMNKGKIEEMGEADGIYSNPESSYTKKLIDAIPKG